MFARKPLSKYIYVVNTQLQRWFLKNKWETTVIHHPSWLNTISKLDYYSCSLPLSQISWYNQRGSTLNTINWCSWSAGPTQTCSGVCGSEGKTFPKVCELLLKPPLSFIGWWEERIKQLQWRNLKPMGKRKMHVWFKCGTTNTLAKHPLIRCLYSAGRNYIRWTLLVDMTTAPRGPGGREHNP